MSWYAVDSIDEAVETTRSFLFPFERGRWLRLAVIMFFISAASSLNGDAQQFRMPAMSLENLFALLLVLLVLALVLTIISRIMLFVLFESIHTEEIHIRRYFRRQLWKGIQLFLFEFGVILVAVIPFVVGVWLFGFVFEFGQSLSGPLFILLAVLAVLFGLVVALGLFVLFDFTRSFVVPVMLLEDRNILSGWQRFWPTLKAEWKQYALYAVLNWFLSLVSGLLFLVMMLVVLLVGALLVGIPTAIGFVLSEIVGLVLLVVFGLIGVLFVLAALLGLQILLRVFFSYYSLHILRKTNDSFDLIPYADETDSDTDQSASE